MLEQVHAKLMNFFYDDLIILCDGLYIYIYIYMVCSICDDVNV